MQPIVAWRALMQLIDDPEDTPKVFEIVRALGGPSIERGFRRFRTTDVGRRVLERDVDLLDTLKDRAALSRLPANSFGRAYYNFTEAEMLSADGLVDASEGHTEQFEDPQLGRYAARLRDMHDLWHTLTQYGRDELGEACLLAFTYAQTHNRGLALIIVVGGFKIRQDVGPGVFRALFRAYRDGRRAAWLPAQDFEALLALPIGEVRKRLGITEPIPYRALRAGIAATA